MALFIKLLAAKAITSYNTDEKVYNSKPSGGTLPLRSSLVRNIRIANKHASAVCKVNVYVVSATNTDSTSAKFLCALDQTIPANSAITLRDEITLSRKDFGVTDGVHGDMIVLKVTSPTSGVTVDCTVFGLERDL